MLRNVVLFVCCFFFFVVVLSHGLSECSEDGLLLLYGWRGKGGDIVCSSWYGVKGDLQGRVLVLLKSLRSERW